MVQLHVISRIGKYMETESKQVVAIGWKVGMESKHLMGMGLPRGVMKNAGAR
jgi:hypothetical protein